jgi:NitT/TauT family transport system substrate-binding protein
MYQTLRKVIPILALLALAAGCDKPSPTPQMKAEPEKVTIAQFGHVFLYLPLYVAKEKGYFAENGLDITLVSTGGDDKTFAAVASGSAQYGVADPVFTAIAREQGRGGKVVASLVNGVPFWGVTFDKNQRTIENAAGFAGLRIATYPSPSTNYAVMNETLKNQGQPVKATIVPGAFGTLLALLKSGQADIAMELEPVASIAASEGGTVVYSAARKYGDFAFTGITVSDDYLAKNPKQVQAVVNSIAKALAYVRSDFEGALAVAKKEFSDVPEPVLRSALKRVLDDNVIPQSVELSEAAWNKSVDLRRKLGEIKGTAAYAENVDSSFAQAAK